MSSPQAAASLAADASAESVLAFCLALLQQKSPELAAVVHRWQSLPDPIRRAILAMVEAAG